MDSLHDTTTTMTTHRVYMRKLTTHGHNVNGTICLDAAAAAAAVTRRSPFVTTPDGLRVTTATVCKQQVRAGADRRTAKRFRGRAQRETHSCRSPAMHSCDVDCMGSSVIARGKIISRQGERRPMLQPNESLCEGRRHRMLYDRVATSGTSRARQSENLNK